MCRQGVSGCGKGGKVFYRGETIVMRLRGTETINLETMAFAVAITNADYTLIRSKAECERVEPNVYVLRIDAGTSAKMPVGMYDIEVLLSGEEDRHIAKAVNALVIQRSCFDD